MMLQNGRSCLAVGINHYRMHWKKSYSCFYLCSFSFSLVGDVTLKILCWDSDETPSIICLLLLLFLTAILITKYSRKFWEIGSK